MKVFLEKVFKKNPLKSDTQTYQCDFCRTCTKKSSKPCVRRKTPVPAPVPAPVPVPVPVPAPVPAPVNNTQIPSEVLPRLNTDKFTPQQIDTMFSIVCIAENASTRWWDQYNYCENIGDGRGLTVSIVGFCSGTYDLLWVMNKLKEIKSDHVMVTKYLSTLQRVNGTSNTSGLENFGSDLQRFGDTYWRQAVWEGIIHFYWSTAYKFWVAMGCKSALSMMVFYDTALNHGDIVLQQFANQITNIQRPSQGGSESAWLLEFINKRQYNIQYVDRSTNNGQPDRCLMHKQIVSANNMSLTRPINGLRCYGGTYSIV